MTMPFGKFRGLPLAEVPEDYLLWLRSIELRPALRAAVDEELHIRREAEARRRSAAGPLGAMLDGPTSEAAARIVQSGYRMAALEAHPDRGGSTEEMQTINAAALALRSWLGRVTPETARRRTA